MCCQGPRDDVDRAATELIEYSELIRTLERRLLEATTFFDLAMTKNFKLHLAVDFSEVHAYLISPPSDYVKDRNKLMRLMVALYYLFDCAKTTLILLPPYIAEMRDILVAMLARSIEDFVTSLLDQGSKLEEILENLLARYGSFSELAPEKVAEIVKSHFPELITSILKHLYSAVQLKEVQARLKKLLADGKLVYFHDYQYWPKGSNWLTIKDNELATASDRFYQVISKTRRYERPLQSRRDAQACLYVERINDALPENEVLILLTHSQELLEAAGSLLSIGDYVKANFPERARSLSLLVPVETVFVFLLCLEYFDNRISVKKTKTRLERLYALVSGLCSNLDVIEHAREGKIAGREDLEHAKRALAERHADTMRLIHQYQLVASAIEANSILTKYIARVEGGLRRREHRLTNQIADFARLLIESKSVRGALIKEATDTLHDLLLQEGFEHYFLDIARSVEFGYPISARLKGHLLRLRDRRLEGAFQRFLDVVAGASRHVERGRGRLGEAFLDLWKVIANRTSSPEAFLVAGFLSFHFGTVKKACAYFEMATELAESIPVSSDVRTRIKFFLALAYRVLSRIERSTSYLRKANNILDSLATASLARTASWKKEKAVVEFMKWEESAKSECFMRGIHLTIDGLKATAEDNELLAYLRNNLAFSFCRAFEMSGNTLFLDVAEKQLKKLSSEIPDERLWEADFVDSKAEFLLARAIAEADERRSLALFDEALALVEEANRRAVPRNLFRKKLERLRILRDFGLHSRVIGLNINDKTRIKELHVVPFLRSECNITGKAGKVEVKDVPSTFRSFQTVEEAKKRGYRRCPYCTRYSLSVSEVEELVRLANQLD